MKQTSLVAVIFSLLFFSFFVFTNFTLFISQFSHSFSYLFLIFIRQDQLFDKLSTFLFFCGFVLSVASVIASSWNQRGNISQRLIMLGLSVVFIYLVVLNNWHTHKQEDIMDMFAIEGSIYYRGFFDLVRDYFPRIALVICVYIFFVYIPLLFLIFGIRPNQDNQIGRMLFNMRPSINIVIVALFALALQPYYYRDNVYVYLDIVMLIGGLGMFIYVMRRHKEIFGFYEYANFILLVLGIVVFAACSSVLAVSDNYFNARYTFLVFVFVWWCAEWMYLSLWVDEE